jgi:hypothetical protein
VDGGAAAAVELRVLPFQVPGERRDLLAGLGERRGAFEAAAHDELPIVAVIEEGFGGVGRENPRHRQRHVDVGVGEEEHSRERFRGDADHGEVHAVQRNDAPDDPGVASESRFQVPPKTATASRRAQSHRPEARPIFGRRLDPEVVARDHHPRTDPGTAALSALSGADDQ